jgi:glycosyltransferase involved in cell wall biosynthesis
VDRSAGALRRQAQRVSAGRSMSMASNRRICLVPRVSGVGGMVSFYHKLKPALEMRGFTVCDNLSDGAYSAVLVIGGTRQLPALWQARRRGARIVQRLDGMNWLHRMRQREPISLNRIRHYVRAEYGNRLLAFIRARLADRVVYQSRFVRGWWERTYGPAPVPNRVVYNGVDLQAYAPNGSQVPPQDRYRLLMVEGSLMGGYEIGLEVGVGLAQKLAASLQDGKPGLEGRPVELAVVGRVAEGLQARWKPGGNVCIAWEGAVPRERIPEFARSAHMLYSADLHPACPNSVIEALACGLPVLAFDTGALPEMVPAEAGRIVPYGGDAWRLDPPDVQALAEGALQILEGQAAFRQGARSHAEQVFGLDRMVEGYLEALLD